MILHQILDVYPHISFIDKGMTIVHKMHMRCDSLNLFFLELTAMNKVSGRIFHIYDHIIIWSD